MFHRLCDCDVCLLLFACWAAFIRLMALFWAPLMAEEGGEEGRGADRGGLMQIEQASSSEVSRCWGSVNVQSMHRARRLSLLATESRAPGRRLRCVEVASAAQRVCGCMHTRTLSALLDALHDAS